MNKAPFFLPPRTAATQNLLCRAAIVSRWSRFDNSPSAFRALDDDYDWTGELHEDDDDDADPFLPVPFPEVRN